MVVVFTVVDSYIISPHDERSWYSCDALIMRLPSRSTQDLRSSVWQRGEKARKELQSAQAARSEVLLLCMLCRQEVLLFRDSQLAPGDFFFHKCPLFFTYRVLGFSERGDNHYSWSGARPGVLYREGAHIKSRIDTLAHFLAAFRVIHQAVPPLCNTICCTVENRFAVEQRGKRVQGEPRPAVAHLVRRVGRSSAVPLIEAADSGQIDGGNLRGRVRRDP